MSTQEDCSIGFVQETTYKTPVTVSRWTDYVDESLDWNKNVKQGRGIKSGARFARSGRRVVPTADGGGDITIELLSKGLGPLFDSAFGSSTVTLVTGTTWQHVFTLGDTPKSLTIQKGLVEAGGTVDAYTFLGAMIASFAFNFVNDDIGLFVPTFDIGDITTAPAYAAPSYVANANLYHFANWSVYTGALTAATTTALASMATQLTDIRDASVTFDRAYTTDRFNGGGGGRKSKPTAGMPAGSGQLTVEYDNTTFRDAVLNDTEMGLLFQYTGGALSTGLETLQLVLPAVKFDSELAKTNGADLITQSMAFQVLENVGAVQLVVRTADAAL